MMNERWMTLTFENSKRSEFIKTVKNLISELVNTLRKIEKQAFNSLQFISTLVSDEIGIAAVTILSKLLKPSNLIFDHCVACRTSNFNFFLIENDQSFTHVDNSFWNFQFYQHRKSSLNEEKNNEWSFSFLVA